MISDKEDWTSGLDNLAVKALRNSGYKSKEEVREIVISNEFELVRLKGIGKKKFQAICKWVGLPTLQSRENERLIRQWHEFTIDIAIKILQMTGYREKHNQTLDRAKKLFEAAGYKVENPEK